MARVFAYCRVSTADQTTANQLQEIEAAGFQVDPRRALVETISGSVAAAQRPAFAKLLDRLEPGDVLVVTKLDRLGRDTIDVVGTVDRLRELEVRVHCLALGGAELTSPAGRMVMTVLASVAQFERDLIVERTQAGLAKAKAEGKALGRPSSLTEAQQQAVREALAVGTESISELARRFSTSRQTILRCRAGI